MNDARISRSGDDAATLRALHAGPGMLVLPNAWDAASARAFAAAGFPALATTSGGVSNALGYEDQQQAPVEAMLAAAERIISSVSIPVSVDFEAGYSLGPEEIVRRLVAVGAAGLNFEDSDHVHGGLVDAESQAERIAAIRAAGVALGSDLHVNARVDVFIRSRSDAPEHVEEGLRRARLYKDAGADCIYPITLSRPDLIAEFVRAVGVVNVNIRRDGPLSLQELSTLGVRRVTYATSIFREAMEVVAAAAAEIRANEMPA